MTDERDVLVVGECSTGSAAVSAIEQMAPDLVFLDIQMPEVNGFDVARTVGPERMPVVVFVTAYDEYALEAFEVHAARLPSEAVQRGALEGGRKPRAEPVAQRRAASLNERLLALLPDGRTRPAHHDRILVKSSGRTISSAPSRLTGARRPATTSGCTSAPKEHLVRDTMSHFQEALDPAHFARIHRSTIVNIDRIRELRPSLNGEYVVVLETGAHLTLSRGHRDALRTRIGTR